MAPDVRFLYYNGMGGVVLAAISAIDIALYDIVGKKLGVPVYQLLGGKVQQRLRVYANGWTEGAEKSPASYARRTKELVAKGYTGCKFDPFSGSPVSREVTQAQLRDAVALVKAIREAGGPDYDIAIDVHARWNTKSTIEIIRAIQGFRLFFYEEAVPPENIDAMVEVQRVVDAARHRRAHLRPARLPRAAREAGGADHPARHRPHRRDHQFKKIAAMADTYYIPVAPHNPNGPICTVASIGTPASRSQTSSSSSSSSPTRPSSTRLSRAGCAGTWARSRRLKAPASASRSATTPPQVRLRREEDRRDGETARSNTLTFR